MTDATELSHKHPRNLNDFIRSWNDVLCLWRLCRASKCIKTRKCHGADARRCFEAHFSLVPDNLIAFMHAIKDAHEQGLSYEDAIDSMRGTNAENALEEWYEAIRYSDAILKAKNLTWAEPG